MMAATISPQTIARNDNSRTQAGFATRARLVVPATLVILFSAECLPMKQQGSVRMLHRVIPAMIAWIEVTFMRIIRLSQHVVQDLGSRLKSVIVFGAAIKVDLQSAQFLGVLRQCQRVVVIPVLQIL